MKNAKLNNAVYKIKHVFVPLMLLGLDFIVCYSLLYFLFYVKIKALPLTPDVAQYGIPICLGFVCVLIFIRPRVHLLKLDRENGGIRSLYYLITVAVFLIPLIFTLGWLETATGKLSRLESIDEISQKPQTKYYTVNSYVVAKEKAGVELEMRRGGKRNEKIFFEIYIASPVWNEASDTRGSPKAFITTYYQKQIPANISEDEKLKEWEGFRNESFEKFDSTRLDFQYLEIIGKTNERERLIKAAQKSPVYRQGTEILLFNAIDKPFEGRNGKRLQYAFLSFGIGALVWFILIVIPGLYKEKATGFDKGVKPASELPLRAVWNFIKPRKGFAATPILIALNVAVFLFFALAGWGFERINFSILFKWGVSPHAVERGEWWRIITAMFLHAGFIHLFMNMVCLYAAGILVEFRMNTWKFIVVYLLSGIISNLISVWWHDPPVIAIGASGAVFGVYGVLLFCFIVGKSFAGSKKSMLIFLAYMVVYNLFAGVFSPGTDNGSHVGGLIAGFALSFLVLVRSGIRSNASTSFKTP